MAPPKTAAKLSIAVRTFDRMRGEIAEMGAQTPHELMRAVEVSFIRDCAEMAARSSLTRTESRWGLYHDRADLPGRDDSEWGYHLNLLKDTDGEMAFLKRPVAPYFVPVPELDGLPPTDRTVHRVEQPPLVGGQAPDSTADRESSRPQPISSRRRRASPRSSPSRSRSIADLQPYLDRRRRRGAANRGGDAHRAHSRGYAPALFAALDDADAAVRRTGADGIRELVEVLPDPAGVRPHLQSGDSVVRAVAVYLLAARRAGEATEFRRALTDSDHRVRIEAVRALVSVDDVAGVVAATGDENREVRIAAAAGLATLRGRPEAEPRRQRRASCSPIPTRWYAPLRSPRWLNSVAAKTISRPSNRRCGRRRGRFGQGAARALSGAEAELAVPAISV